MGFSQIEVVTSMNRLSNLKAALSELGVSGMTVIQAIGCGAQKGTFEYEAEQRDGTFAETDDFYRGKR